MNSSVEHYSHRERLHARTTERERNRAAGHIRRRRAQLEVYQQADRLRTAGPDKAIAVFGPGYSGLGGNSATEAKARILYPKERKRPRRHLRELYLTRTQYRQVALEEEVLVPVRLDFDSDKFKLRDTFTWNLNDRTIPLDLFADHLCEDYKLPPGAFVDYIKRTLAEQLNEFHPHKFPEIQSAAAADVDGKQATYTDYRDDDLRIPVKLDITIGRLNLTDQFEWDISDASNRPEQFAQSLCLELGLPPEFQTAVAHAIREQCQLYTKSLFLVGHTFDGSAVADGDVRQALMGPLGGDVHRPNHLLDEFAPMLSELLPDQLERVEKEREREGRRNRRQTRTKRGPNLPDLTDLPKTYRTPYYNKVLIPEDERSADRFGIMRDALPGAAEELQASDEDDAADDTSLRDPGERSTRASRYARGHQTAQSHANTPTQLTGLGQRGAASVKSQSSAPDSPHYTSATLPRHAAEISRAATQRTQSGRVLFSEDAFNTGSPSPSLIVKLRVPRLRQLLAQKEERLRQAQLGGMHKYSQHLQQQQQYTAALMQESHSALPLWLVKRLQALHESYPKDRFEPVMLPPSLTGERPNMGISIRCLHCAGAIVNLDDFDKHLQSRDHRFRVDA